jgi:hypothetical protein
MYVAKFPRIHNLSSHQRQNTEITKVLLQHYRGPERAYCQAHGLWIKEYGFWILDLSTTKTKKFLKIKSIDGLIT